MDDLFDNDFFGLEEISNIFQNTEYVIPEGVTSTAYVEFSCIDNGGNLGTINHLFEVRDNTAPFASFITPDISTEIFTSDILFNVELNATDNTLLDSIKVYFYDSYTIIL